MSEFNKQPYFDDHNPDKNHKKVLFVAGRPVQARELNQIQSIAQDQQKTFAGHIFKDGSRVSGGSVTNLVREYVRLASTSMAGTPIEFNNIQTGMKLVGASSGVEAIVLHKFDVTESNPHTLIVDYTKVGKDAVQTRFVAGEEIEVRDGNDALITRIMVKCPTCPGYTDTQDKIAPCGRGAKFITVDEGTFYYDGFFVKVKRGEICYSLYGEPTTCKIGFDVVERVITPEEDVSLYDNALGYPNETAPGAHRYTVNFVLTKRTNKPADGVKFIELASIEEGYVQLIKSDFQYSNIMDTMAQRTFEESGNYTVFPWNVRYREHNKAFEEDPNGFIMGGDNAKLNCLISTGVGYVRGYRIETTNESFINIPKARTTNKVYDGSIYFAEGAYIDLVPDETMSIWANNPATQGTVDLSTIQLYDGEPNHRTPTGKVVGHIRVSDAVYVGEKNGEKVWRYSVIDFEITDPNATVKCVSSETNRFLATIPKGTQFRIMNQNTKSLVYKLPKRNAKSIRDNDRADRSATVLQLRKKLTASLDSNGATTFTINDSVFDSNIKDTVIIVGTAGDYATIYATSDNCKPAGNSMRIELGSSNSGKRITVIQTVNTVGLLEKQKTSMATFLNKVDRAKWSSWIGLGKADVYTIEKIEAYASSAPETREDVTAKFDFDNGIRAFAYTESKVKMRQGETISNSFDMVDIKFRYFNHTDTNNSGYFSVDSYSTVIADEESGVDYGSLPVYEVDGELLPASDVLDFRPILLDDAIAGQVPATKTTAIFNLEYYVGRKDLMCVDKFGAFFHLYGTPSDDPKSPINLDDGIMPLYEVLVPAYTYSYQDVRIKRIENKRYTMRDIGRLERRIDNLEYYTTLSALESEAMADDVKDAQGLSRFKNGFIVDDFKKFATGDILNNEYNATNDRERGELRPYYYMQSRTGRVNLAKSINAIMKAGVVIKPYTHELANEQPFATRSVSVNPYIVFRREGNMVLTPNMDNWTDTDRQPNMNIEIDTGVDAVRQLAERQNTVVTAFNDWMFANNNTRIPENGSVNVGIGRTIDRRTNVQSNTVTTSSSSVQNISNWSGTGTQRVDSTTATTTTTVNRSTTTTETRAGIESRTNTYEFDRVTDVSIIPYMRATQIEFTAGGLYPNTRHYVFFDGVDVTSLTTIAGSSEKIKDALVAGVLLSDANGVLAGKINIPAGRFFSGVKDVRVTSDPNNTGDEDNEVSFAKAQFFAGGINQQKQAVNLQVTTPVYNEVQVSNTVSTSATTVSSNTTSRATLLSWTQFDRGGRGDPLAQSFKLERDCMISKLDLYFETVDPDTEVIVEIRTMENGYPTTVVLGSVTKPASQINTSWDATASTSFEFPTPVRVQQGVEYCFVILGDTPATRAWVSHLGEKCVNIPNKVADAQVTLGSSFRSQNGSTWNAEQFEDLMYRLYVAKFNEQPMTLAVDVSGGLEEQPLDISPFEGEQGSNLVRVYVKNDHALNVGDKIMLNLYPNSRYNVQLNNGHIVPGHYLEIDNQRSSAKVKSVSYRDATHAVLELEKLQGAITPSSTFLATAFVAKPGKADAFGAYYNINVEDYDIRQSAGIFVNVDVPQELNGIPLQELNGTHQVKRIDDNKSFVIELNSRAEKTGRFGPKDALIIMNHKADLLNVSANYQLHGNTEVWNLESFAHGDKGSLFESSNYQRYDDLVFEMKSDRYLARPIKLANSVNEREKMANEPSIRLKGVISGVDPYLSPVYNEDSFSVIAISNDIYPIDKDTLNQDPNGVGRFREETHPHEGSERFKYVSQTVALANPASDIKIWFDMYKPTHTDFDLYVKLQTANVQNLDDIEWVKVENIDKTLISTSLSDMVEYQLLLSEQNPTLSGSQNMFSAFKVKLVGRTKNSAIPPLFRNLRMVAYT